LTVPTPPSRWWNRSLRQRAMHKSRAPRGNAKTADLRSRPRPVHFFRQGGGPRSRETNGNELKEGADEGKHGRDASDRPREFGARPQEQDADTERDAGGDEKAPVQFLERLDLLALVGPPLQPID